MNLPEAIFFDLDDTLLDEGDSTACWLAVCHAHSEALAPITPVQLHQAIDEYSNWYWSDPERHRIGRLDIQKARCDISHEALLSLGVADRSLADEVGKLFVTERARMWALMPRAEDLLQRIRAANIKLALLTNGHPSVQRDKINRFRLAPYFDVIIVEGEFCCGKPDRRVYEHALQSVGSSPAQTWMVGDNLEWDVAGAQAVGIAGIWVDAKGRGLPQGCSITPDRVIQGVHELLAHFEDG